MNQSKSHPPPSHPMVNIISATQEKLVAPVPLPERGRPFSFDVTKTGNVAYPHGKSIHKSGEALEFRHSHTTSAISVAPCGDKFAIGDVTGGLCILEGDFSNPIVRYKGQVIAGRINSICWDSESKYVAVTGDGHRIYTAVIIVESGQSLGEFAGPTKSCNGVSIRPTLPARIVIASDDFTTLFYSGPPFYLVKTIRNHTRFVSATQYSPDGSLFVSGGADGKIFVYNGDDGNLIDEVTSSCGEAITCSITCIKWGTSNLAKILYSGGTDGIIRKWDLKERTCESSEPFKQQILGLEGDKVGSGIIAILLDGTIVHLSDCLTLLNSYSGHRKTISAIFVEDQLIKYTGDIEGRLFDWKSKGFIPLVGSKNHSISFIGKDGGGETIVISGLDGKAFEIGSGQNFSIPPETIAQGILGSLIVTIGLEGLTARSIKGGGEGTQAKFLKEVKCATIVVGKDSSSSAAAAAATCLVVTSSNEIVKVVIDPSGKVHLLPEWKVKGNIGKIKSLAGSGNLLAAGDDQRRIQLYEISSQTMLPTKWCFHTSTVSCLDWSPNGKYLISGGLDNNILIWSPEQMTKPIVELKNAHAGSINLVKFITEELFCSCASDSTLRFWRLATA